MYMNTSSEETAIEKECKRWKFLKFPPLTCKIFGFRVVFIGFSTLFRLRLNESALFFYNLIFSLLTFPDFSVTVTSILPSVLHISTDEITESDLYASMTFMNIGDFSAVRSSR